MYSHGLATMALCEAYGMMQDTYVGEAASRALRYIELAQNPTDRRLAVFSRIARGYVRHRLASDGPEVRPDRQLPVNPAVLENTEKWLRSMASGRYGGLYRYQAQHDPTPSMTAVGMLCRQYLGIDRDAPSMVEGKAYLLAHPPNAESDRDIYYWYYATLAMHNFMDKEWDEWNRQMRRTSSAPSAGRAAVPREVGTRTPDGGPLRQARRPADAHQPLGAYPGGLLSLDALVQGQFAPIPRARVPIQNAAPPAKTVGPAN